MPVLSSVVIDGKRVRVMVFARAQARSQASNLRTIRRMITQLKPVDEWVIDHFQRNPELAKLPPDGRAKVIDAGISDWTQFLASMLALEIELAAQCGEESQFWPPRKTA